MRYFVKYDNPPCLSIYSILSLSCVVSNWSPILDQLFMVA